MKLTGMKNQGWRFSGWNSNFKSQDEKSRYEMLIIWNHIKLMGWNCRKGDHLWISIQFHPHIFISLYFISTSEMVPLIFWINFSRSGFFKFLLKDEKVIMKLVICTISSYDISSWKLIGLIPQPFIIVTNQHQESICF